MATRETMDIEALVHWTYALQKADRAVASVTECMRPSTTTTNSLVQLLELGCRVDTSGQGAGYAAMMTQGLAVADDALTVHDAVISLPTEHFCQVILHGRRGTRPDWHPEGYGRLVPVTDKRGRPSKIWRDEARRRHEIGCLVKLDGTAHELVDFSRAQYATWWAGLDALARFLPGRLARHDVTGPAAPRRPWEKARGRVLAA